MIISLDVLVKKAKGGSEDAFNEILKRLEPKIKSQCRKFFVPGGDREDILQEARIGLYKAIHDFDNSSFDISFENFALQICIRRRLITIISAAHRGKSEPLNTSLSLDVPIVSEFDEGSSQTAMELIPDEGGDPIGQLVDQEDGSLLRQRIYNQLTELEQKVLANYEMDYSYREIAEMLGINEKCVDNSLVRIRKKAQETVQQNE